MNKILLESLDNLDSYISLEEVDMFGAETDEEIEAEMKARRDAAHAKRKEVIDGDILAQVHNYKMLDQAALGETLAKKKQIIVDYLKDYMPKVRSNPNSFTHQAEYKDKPVDPAMLEKLAEYIIQHYAHEDGIKFRKVDLGGGSFTYYDADGKKVVFFREMVKDPEKQVFVKDAKPLTESERKPLDKEKYMMLTGMIEDIVAECGDDTEQILDFLDDITNQCMKLAIKHRSKNKQEEIKEEFEGDKKLADMGRCPYCTGKMTKDEYKVFGMCKECYDNGVE